MDIKEKRLGRIIAEQHAYNTHQEVSIRIDFEGDVAEDHRGISLDFGSIGSDVHGLSFLVGSVFATGDIRSAEREERSTRLNHSPLAERFGNPQTIYALATTALGQANATVAKLHPSSPVQKSAA